MPNVGRRRYARVGDYVNNRNRTADSVTCHEAGVIHFDAGHLGRARSPSFDEEFHDSAIPLAVCATGVAGSCGERAAGALAALMLLQRSLRQSRVRWPRNDAAHSDPGIRHSASPSARTTSSSPTTSRSTTSSKLAAASNRVKLINVGKTSFGKTWTAVHHLVAGEPRAARQDPRDQHEARASRRGSPTPRRATSRARARVSSTSAADCTRRRSRDRSTRRRSPTSCCRARTSPR